MWYQFQQKRMASHKRRTKRILWCWPWQPNDQTHQQINVQMQKHEQTMEKTTKKTTKMVQQKNKPIKWLHWKTNLQPSQKIWYHSLWRKLLYYQDLNRRRAKHDISSIAIHKKTKRQIPTLQKRSRRRTIRKTTQHKQNMPPLRTHKQRVKSQKTQLEMSKMRKNTW